MTNDVHRIDAYERVWLVVSGLGFSGYYLASFLDFAGLAYITASLERLILYLNPTLVLALGVIDLRRWTTPRVATLVERTHPELENLLVTAAEIASGRGR